MARIRSVHPSLFTDEAWVTCSPMARLLYIGLWTDADDQGLFEWKPLQIRMRLLPGDNADVEALLQEMVTVDLIAILNSGGKKLGAIQNFRKFQRPKKPNKIFVLPAEWVEYVGLGELGSEPGGDDDAPVGNRFHPEPEIAPQMEDGGGVGKREGKEEVVGGVTSASAFETRPDDWPTSDAARTLARTVDSPWLDMDKSHGLITTAGILDAWRRAGACWNRDVIPVVTGICTGQREPVSTWKFFQNAVLRAAAENGRALELPEPATVVAFRGAGPPGLIDRIGAENAESERRALERIEAAKHG